MQLRKPYKCSAKSVGSTSDDPYKHATLVPCFSNRPVMNSVSMLTEACWGGSLVYSYVSECCNLIFGKFAGMSIWEDCCLF